MGIAAVGLLAMLSVGCGHSHLTNTQATVGPTTAPVQGRTLLALDDIEPRLTLPVPATAPTTAPAGVTLQLYAQARDAMITDDRAKAIRLLEQALEQDPESAQMLLDLTYCLLGQDNEKAARMLVRAIALDPQNAQSRLALARLRLVAGDYEKALTQLRYVRLTGDYQDSDTTHALADLLLARTLERCGYVRAAVDTYEQLLTQVLDPTLSMRSNIELAELVRQPDGLRIVLAQLCRQVGRNSRAIELLGEVQKSQPAVRDALELQIIKCLASDRQIGPATQRTLDLAHRTGPVRQLLATYTEIYANHGGVPAALHQIDDRLRDTPGDGVLRMIGAHLCRLNHQPDRGLRLLEPVVPDVLSVRQTVRCYVDMNDLPGAARRLLHLTTATPGRYAAVRVGWQMLFNDTRPQSLSTDDLARLDIPAADEGARQYTLFAMSSARANAMVAARARTQALQLSPANVQVWDAAPQLPPVVDVDATDPQDVVDQLRDVQDDPTYLLITVAQFLQNKQQAQLIAGMSSVLQSDPSQLLILSNLVELLQEDDRKPEAIQLVDKAINPALTPNQLYVISGLYMRLGEEKSNERVLRLVLQRDPNHAGACNDLGYQLADAGRETEYAEQLIQRAVKAEPDNVMFLDSLGWIYYKYGKFADAAKWLADALDKSLVPDAVVLDHAGDAYYRLGDFDKARDRWQQSVEQIRNGASVEPQLRLKIELKLKTLASKKPVDVAPTLTPAPTTQQETPNGRP